MVLEKHYNNKIRVIDQIGQGGFGKVYLIRTRSSDEYPDIQYYAMKVILKSRIINSEKKIIYAKNEMEILASIDNPFVVKLYYAFHCSEKLYLIMELMTGGDLRRLMNQKITLTENETKFYTASITMALEHLHSLKIIYRDLKPENVMFDVNGCLKLVDLGLCKVVNSVDEKTSTICGTIEYLAPEVVSKKRYDMMVDWWSLGILTYDMLLGSTPFPSDNRKKLINKIVSEVPNIPKLVSKEATSFMKQLLFKNPKKRLGVNKFEEKNEVRQHPFFKKVNFDDIYGGIISVGEFSQFLGDLDELDNSKNTIGWSNLGKMTNHLSVIPDEDQSDEIIKKMRILLDDYSYVSPSVSQIISKII